RNPSWVRYSDRVSRISSSSSTTRIVSLPSRPSPPREAVVRRVRVSTMSGPPLVGRRKDESEGSPGVFASGCLFSSFLLPPSSFRCRPGQGQPDPERRALAGDGRAVHDSTMIAHQPASDEQPQPGAVLLRREIGLEQALGLFGVDATPLIAHA